MEAAFAVVALVSVLVVGLAGVTAVSMQMRCIDAAREAARLAARGDERSALLAAREVAPAGAGVQLRRRGEFVGAEVTAESAVLPRVSIRAEAWAAVEQGRG